MEMEWWKRDDVAAVEMNTRCGKRWNDERWNGVEVDMDLW